MNNFAKIRFFFIIPLVCVGLFSCDPSEELPDELILEYVGVQNVLDSVGDLADIVVRVNFQSGKGNIGLFPRDTVPPFVGKYLNNLFVHVFDRVSLTDTIYEPLQDGRLPPEAEDVIRRFRIPVANMGGQKSVKGTFDISFLSGFKGYQMLSQHGIIRLEIYMYDRDFVSSNIVVTPDIQIR